MPHVQTLPNWPISAGTAVLLLRYDTTHEPVRIRSRALLLPLAAALLFTLLAVTIPLWERFDKAVIGGWLVALFVFGLLVPLSGPEIARDIKQHPRHKGVPLDRRN